MTRILAAALLALPAAAAALTLEGTYERRTDAYSKRVLGDAVCFVPDEKFEKALPRPAGDERRAWFCFSNRAEALKALAIPAAGKGCGMRGAATIAVSGYVVGSGDEAVDRARLDRVVSRKPAKPIPCNE